MSQIIKAEHLVSERLAAREQAARDTLAKMAADARAAGKFSSFKAAMIFEANTLDIRDGNRRIVKQFFREEEENATR